MSITLHDIARKSGFSVTTVSRVFNKQTARYRISLDTAKYILQVAGELNYRPNQIARGLRLKKTHTLGLIVPDISNPFFAYLIRIIQKFSHTFGYSLVVCDTDENVDLENEHIEVLRSKSIDGLIIMPVGQSSSHLEHLVLENMPLVLVDRCFEGLQTSSVTVDNRRGAFEAVDYVAGCGHRRIAIVQGLPHTYANNERVQGYREALSKNEISPDERLMVGKDFRSEAGYAATRQLLRIENPPTAIFATSDLIALGAIQAIREEGLTIPDHISLVAFDDIEFAMSLACPITAVAQPKEQIGETAVKLLIDQIRNRGKHRPKHVVIAPKLIVRDSVRKIDRPDGRTERQAG